MADCGFSVKNTCGERLFATCVYYEGILPAFTNVPEANCYTLEEIVADVYQQFQTIYDELEVDSLLGDLSLTYTLVNSKVVVRQALKTFEQEIDSLKTKVDNIAKYQLCDLPIAGCNLNLGALEDACGNQITNFGELFQALIDGGVGAGAVIVAFDLFNNGFSSLTVTISQPGEADQIITSDPLQTTVVNININKEVTITTSGGAEPIARVADSRYAFNNITILEGIAFDFTQSMINVLVTGVNNNPRIELYDS
jgi:hypothetical protein